MEKEELIKFFSEFWKIPVSEINDNLKLDSTNLKGNTSIRFYQFLASLESTFKVKITDIGGIVTFKDLLERVNPK